MDGETIKQTLNLPQTSFSMKAKLAQKEPEILKQWEEKSYLLRHLHAGDCFGEVALMDFCRRSASVLADEDCAAIELSTSDLRQIANRDLEQFTMIYMNMGRELCRRLREADQRLFRAKVEVGLSTGEYAFPTT